MGGDYTVCPATYDEPPVRVGANHGAGRVCAIGTAAASAETSLRACWTRTQADASLGCGVRIAGTAGVPVPAADGADFGRMGNRVRAAAEAPSFVMNADHQDSSEPHARSEASTDCPSQLIEALIDAAARFIAGPARAFILGAAVPWSDQAQRRTVPPSSLPVLRHLPQCLKAAPPGMRPVVSALCEAAAMLAWRQTYSAQQMSRQFLERYGWTELVGLGGPVPSRECAAGFLILGPDIEYPAHHHEARELYLPLAGRAAWWQAQSGWREVSPGETVLHASQEPHAMRTRSEPLLAFYLWRSANLEQHAELTGRRGASVSAPRSASLSSAASSSPPSPDTSEEH